MTPHPTPRQRDGGRSGHTGHTGHPGRIGRLQPRLLPLLLALLMLPAAPLQAQDPPKPANARRSTGLSGKTPVTVNFVNADIEAVTRAMGAMLDRQILVDPRVKGLITVYSEQAIPMREAWLQYLAALRGLGFTVVEVSGLLKVLPEPDAKLQTGTVSVGEVGARGDQVITQIFRLNHENPNNLVAVLRPLISPNNTINANPGNNTLVITDYADNLSRLGKIIAALDQPAASEVEVIPLQHAIASDMAALVQKLGEGGGASVVPGVPVAAAAGMTVMADARSNSLIVRTSNPARLASLRALVERLDRPGVGGPAGQINVVYLKNADATKLASVLRAAFGGGGGGGGSVTSSPSTSLGGAGVGLNQGNSGGSAANTAATTPIAQSAQPSTGGFIQADPATNSLVITAAEPLYRQIRSVIDQLDGRRAQVFVESMIVEMDATKAAELGFQWQGLLGQSGDRFGLAAGTNFGSSGNNILNLSLAAAAGSTSALPGTGLNLGLLQRVNGVTTLGALARFLETVDGSNILSTPNLVALDNEEAKIVVGQNVPFVTGSFTNTGSSSATVNPFQTVERKDVGLTLKIKPQIGEGGVIRMTVFQENSSVVGSTLTNNNGPTTNKNSVETTIVADDGQIMVLGGQMREVYTDGENKVPMLGDVPVMGNLFKNSSRTRSKSIMLVFLRPVVIRDAQAASTLSLDRYEAIRAQQQAQQPTPKALLPINESPMLPATPAKGQPLPVAPVPATPKN